jgi:hypothetical protein
MYRVLARIPLAILAAALVTGASTTALAEDQHGWVGGLLGMTVPNKDKTSARPMWGISGGAKLGSEFGLGAYYLNSNNDEQLSTGAKVNFGFDLYGIEAAYHFEGEAKGVYVGGRIGMSKVKVADFSTSPAHWGIVGGYNHMIADNVSIGSEASYMSIANSSYNDNAGTSASIDSFSLLSFLLSAKLWF